MSKDKVNHMKVSGLAAVASATDKVLAVRRLGYGALTFISNIGIEGITLSGTDYIQLKLEHADDDGAGAAGTYSACAAEDFIFPDNAPAQVDTTPTDGIYATYNDNAESPVVQAIGYRGSKEWVRLTIDHVGTHGAATPAAAVAILDDPQFGPVP